ncbi:Kinesin motor [Gracilaria domingensis]|nr:Kinesin motor [Gracilaria domingensis]
MEPPRPNGKTNAIRDKVQVAVRLRPLLKREISVAKPEHSTYWSTSPTSITQCIDDKPVPFHSFSFDHIFLPNSTNESVFNGVARPVVASAVDGINGVIFAYGQTAAGKTHTMLGNTSDPGITLRSISDLFERISKLPSRKFLLRASYIEIYNEIIRDLLVPSNDNLKIHEDVVSNMVYVNSHRKVITSVEDAAKIISAGEAVRAIGATNMNEKASRSHTIFTVSIESREILRSTAETASRNGVAVRNSTLALVDLAGSERASLTKAHGKRLTEGGFINKSLLTLGTVIKKLSSEFSKANVHIPYRDSKLTRLLQPALGGNARTVIICAVTTASVHMEETLSTLKFASRAKRVTNHAETNEFLDDRAKLRRAEKQIAYLKKEMKRLKSFVAANSSQTSAEEAQAEGEKQRWELKVEKTVSEILSLMRGVGDECPKCLTPVNTGNMLEREGKVRLLKHLMENFPRKLRSEGLGEEPETIDMLFNAVKQLQTRLLEKEVELQDIESQLEALPSTEDDTKYSLDYGSDHERPMSICTTDETLTQKSLDSTASSEGSFVGGAVCNNSSELLEDLRRNFGEKRIELEEMFRKLKRLKMETRSEHGPHENVSVLEPCIKEEKVLPIDHGVDLGGKQIPETSLADQCSLIALKERTEKKKRIGGSHSANNLTLMGDRGNEIVVPELVNEGKLFKLSNVVRRVLIASCAIWFHCGLSRVFNFGTNRGLVGICMGNVTDCSSCP